MLSTENNTDCQLFLPTCDEKNPELSIVIPALNEELTISAFLAWCFEGIKKANIAAEILIIDSSSDKTAELALASGARVLKVPKRGLGRAYIDSLPHIRGKYILMGDSDCTYDFREISPFVEKFKEGYEFIMGSRFKGQMEKNAMPPLHRYFGIPLTTFIYNLIYGQHFSDIHCGMRGITYDAFKRMNLQSQSWEYASEMVVKWSLLHLRVAEVPITFYKDREGRLSHHKRLGFLSPWLAGWINLKVMLVYGADFFLLKPGISIASIGIITVICSLYIGLHYGNDSMSFILLMGGALALTFGITCFYTGIISQVLYDVGNITGVKWLKYLSYDNSLYISLLSLISSLLLLVFSFGINISHKEHTLFEMAYPIVLAILLLVFAFVNFTFTLVMHAATYIKNPSKQTEAE